MKRFILLLILLTSAMMAPLWILFYLRWPVVDDPLFYATILKNFSAQFWAGEWYPRWLMNTNDGLGSPVFLFYGPVTFYIGSAFQFLSKYDPHGFARLLITMQLALIVAGVTSYRWLRQHLDDLSARKGALLYVTFPYLLAVAYFYFGVAQLWAVACFPLLLEYADDVIKRSWHALWKLAIAYALLTMAHLPSLLVFGAVPWLYVVRTRDLSRILAATGAIILGFCLAGVYLLPFLMNRPYISSDHFIDGKLFYANNFDYMTTLFGIAIVLAPLLKLYVDLPKQERALTPFMRFWLVISAMLLFMATPLSLPLWDAIKPLQYLQFPFRFFIGMLPGVVFIATQWDRRPRYNLYRWMLWAGILLLPWGIYAGAFSADLPPTIQNVLDKNLIVQPEYWPPSFKSDGVENRWQLPEQYRDMQMDVVEGSGSASLLAEEPRRIWLKANIHSPTATLVLKRFYFPGWLTNSPDIHIGDQDGLLAVTLPKGSHDIILAVPRFPGEVPGRTLSMAAILAIISLWRLSARRIGVEKPASNG